MPRRAFLSQACQRWLPLLAVLTAIGCIPFRDPQTVSPPARHSVRFDQLLVQSDFRLPPDHPLFNDLNQLQHHVIETLKVPRPKDTVVVYLFEDEQTYQRYITAAFPNLPKRRAYFVGTEFELGVYGFWSDKVREDLRHEFTHGILHSALGDVPLWLDEGLAEFFEIVDSSGKGINPRYVEQLTSAVDHGWKPSMKRLEGIREFSHLQRMDYAEAWAWVHFMLSDSVDSKRVLTEYLADLRDDPSPTPISKRLREIHPDLDGRLMRHLQTLRSQRRDRN
ncbi:MAG: DUF1570 domain-containing protein [Planctomycetota bacterium]|nr:DUF1570 domain-containing protein [Planctomycetota bacterium]